jgi:hypothetical protein
VLGAVPLWRSSARASDRAIDDAGHLAATACSTAAQLSTVDSSNDETQRKHRPKSDSVEYRQTTEETHADTFISPDFTARQWAILRI